MKPGFNGLPGPRRPPAGPTHSILHSRDKLQCLIAVLVWTGWIALSACATTPRPQGGEVGPSWTCDEEADRALSEGDLERGIQLHEAFLETHPDDALALYHLGFAYGQSGNHEREIACYERAAALGFSKGGLFFNLGMAYGEIGKPRKAVAAFQRAIQTDARNADYRMGLGLALEKTGDMEGAARSLEEALRLDPSLSDARWYLARIRVETGRHDEAEAQLRELLRIDPGHPWARELLRKLESGQRP